MELFRHIGNLQLNSQLFSLNILNNFDYYIRPDCTLDFILHFGALLTRITLNNL